MGVQPFPSPSASRRPSGSPRRRGSSLLEVILAAALLAGVAGAVVQALGAMASAAERRRNILGAYETANRLMLQYIDDKDKMPDGNVPYYDNVNYFRWELIPMEITLEATENGATAPTGSNPQSMAMMRQAMLLQVNVYLSNQRGEVFEQLASIIRPHHPWPLFSPNPNMASRWMADPKNLNDLTSSLLNSASGTSKSAPTPLGSVNPGRSGSGNSSSNNSSGGGRK